MMIFKKLQWGIEYAVYRAVEIGMAILSAEQVFSLGHYLGLLMFHTYRSRRAIVIRNLRMAYGNEMSLEDIKSLAHDVFTRSGSNLLSSFRTASFSDEELAKRMHYPQLEEFKRLFRDKKGVVLLVPHMGNWELLAQAIRYLEPGDQLATHYRKLNNPYLNTHVEAQRAAHGTQLFSKDDSPHAIISLLREGGAIGVLADQRAGHAGYWATYYGNFTTCSPLPEILSKRTGAEVALMYIKTTSPAHWEVIVETLSDTSTPACMKALERATRSSPSDVFWFQERWKITRSNPFGITGKIHPEVDLDSPANPLRLLIWLPSPDASLPALPEKRRSDLQLEVVYPEGSTPPSYPEIPWSRTWPVDASLESEQLPRILRAIDEAEAYPLSGVITTTSSSAIKTATKRVGARYCVVSDSASPQN